MFLGLYKGKISDSDSFLYSFLSTLFNDNTIIAKDTLLQLVILKIVYFLAKDTKRSEKDTVDNKDTVAISPKPFSGATVDLLTFLREKSKIQLIQ